MFFDKKQTELYGVHSPERHFILPELITTTAQCTIRDKTVTVIMLSVNGSDCQGDRINCIV